MAAPKKRGCLGCSFPVLIIVLIIVIGITVVGFLAGAIGQELLHIDMPDWLVVDAPSPHLPAPVLFHVLGLPITNTIITSWITVIFLVVLSWAITRRMKIIPGRLQAAFEFLIGWMYDFCRGIAGDENGRKFFPVVCTIFLYVLFNAWLSLIPGFGSVELIKYEPIPEDAHIETVVSDDGHHEHQVAIIEEEEYEIVDVDGVAMIEVEEELLRGANTDANTPFAIACISFIFVAYFGFKALGIGWLKQYFNFGPFFHSIGALFRGKFNFMDMFSGVVGIFVGFLELLSRFITIVSFTFRLFGNMTAGEILLLVTAYLVPFVLALPFYGLELLIGFVQALIFAGLTLVFVTMAVTPHEHEA